MSTYYNKLNGVGFKEGNLICIEATPDVIKALKELNLVEDKLPSDPKHYASGVAENLGFKSCLDPDFLLWLSHLPAETLKDLVYKQIAIELDDKYEGHISSCNPLFTISRLDGSIGEIKGVKIKKGTAVPLFRNREDAEFAKKIVNSIDFSRERE